MAIAQPEQSDQTGLRLLFAAGKRPSRAEIREFVAKQRSVSLTHDPFDGGPLHLASANGGEKRNSSDAPSQVDEMIWLELLLDGLTFDLRGLAPGPGCPGLKIEHRFGLESEIAVSRMEVLSLVPGAHLAGGERTIPVTKGLVALARDLTHHFQDVVAIAWPPSQSAIERRYFESISTAWLEGGAFPALGLTAFRETIDGALQSVGLDFWVGQELRIEPPISQDKITATRLGVRLINQLVLVGGLSESERIIAPDGTSLVMRPSRNRKFIRVWRE